MILPSVGLLIFIGLWMFSSHHNRILEDKIIILSKDNELNAVKIQELKLNLMEKNLNLIENGQLIFKHNQNFDEYKELKEKEIDSLENEIKKIKKIEEKKKVESEKKDKMTMNLSFYGMDCSGCSGRTASGYKIKSGSITTEDGYRIIASDTSILPFHSIVEITLSNGEIITGKILDTGGAIKGNKLDILVASEAESAKYGRYDSTVKVISYGDGKYRKVN